MTTTDHLLTLLERSYVRPSPASARTRTMRETGTDMLTKYNETARGGLAVNIVKC